jgi:hypothetical protein
MLQRVAEEMIFDARNGGTYRDRTGNLRSSIGYVILQNKRIVFESFPGKSSAGRQKAKALVEKLIKQNLNNESGISLICVAGMAYSVYVEAMGFDVLTMAGFKARTNIKARFEELKRKQLSRLGK